jgi:hypothetical protein
MGSSSNFIEPRHIRRILHVRIRDPHDFSMLIFLLPAAALMMISCQVRAVGKGGKHPRPLNEVAFRGRFGQPFE